MTDILWLGRGGQGAFTAARLLGLAAVRFAGREAMAFPSFGPERRGAPVYAWTRLSTRPLEDRSAVRYAPLAVILDHTLLAELRGDRLAASPLLLIDGGYEQSVRQGPQGLEWRIPAREYAEHYLGSPHTNTVLIGALNGFFSLLPPLALERAITAEFAPHRRAADPLPERASRNLAAFAAASRLGRQQRHRPGPLADWLARRGEQIQEALP